MRWISSPNYGGSRGQVIWIVIHTAEGATTVDALGNYFANPNAQASSHVGIDDREIVQYVDYGQVAWTAMDANPISDQAELCAFAAWTRATWLGHPGMLENTAQWVADRCRARGIPATHISAAQVGAHVPGVIGHIDITNGLYGGSGHTDPGPGFPWDVLLGRVQAILGGQPTPLPTQEEDDDMLLIQCTPPDTKRPAILLAPGYWKVLTVEEAGLANDMVAPGRSKVYNARQYDVAKAVCMQGEVVNGGIDQLNEIYGKVVAAKYPYSDRSGGGHTTDADDELGHILSIHAVTENITTTLTALAQKAETGGIDPVRLQAIMTQAVADALKNIKVVTDGAA